jgi:hypothetical protein
MQWLKQHGGSAWLALLALSMQLLLSFAHHHAPDHARHVTASTLADALVAGGHSDEEDDHDHCAICWSLALASALVQPAPLGLASPAVYRHAPRIDVAVSSVLAVVGASFQPRGPPSSPLIT